MIFYPKGFARPAGRHLRYAVEFNNSDIDHFRERYPAHGHGPLHRCA